MWICISFLPFLYLKRERRKKKNEARVFQLSLSLQMMASKYLYDEGVDEEVFNDEWAENAGVDKEEINNMELDFLDALVSFIHKTVMPYKRSAYHGHFIERI